MRRGRAPDMLLVTQYFPPERGAAQVRLGSIVGELRRAGRIVDVVTALPNYPLGRIHDGWSHRPFQRSRESTGTVTRVWVWAAMGNGPGRILNYLSFAVMSAVAMLLTRRAPVVVVEYPTLFGALPAVVLGRLRGQRVVLIVADLWVDSIVETGTFGDGPVVRILRRVERWMLRRAHVVTAVTEGVRDALVRKGVEERRLAWLPNGVDVELFRPREPDPTIRAELGLPPDAHLMLYAGTHGYVHGLEVVLDAADRLRDAPVHFVLVGGGSEKEALEAEARRRDLHNVSFHDPVEPADVARLLTVATAGLATVRSGELYRTVRSAKMLPSMASGRPVIYSADDEGSRLVRDAGAGLVTPPGDGAALAAAVSQVMEDPGLATRTGAAGRRWVLDNAAWGPLVDRWVHEITRDGPHAVSTSGLRDLARSSGGAR